MNRLEKCFRRLAGEKRRAAIVYLTAGYPSLEDTAALVPLLAESGVDVVELGVPFSDPIADGVTIQHASAAALAGGATLPRIFETAARIREKTPVPLVLMGYYNPILAHGLSRFTADCETAGVDGLIVPDLPPEEAGPLLRPARRAGVNMIFLLAPNSPPDRVRLVGRLSRPFVYYVSVTGVTGTRRRLPPDLAGRLAGIRRCCGKPVCLGFGVSGPAQAGRLAPLADGVIVGSAFLKAIDRAGARKEAAARDFARRLALSVHRVPGSPALTP